MSLRFHPQILVDSDLPPPTDAEEFWAAIDHRGTPLISRSGRPDERRATFLYRCENADQIYLEANRLTDKRLIERGRMQRLEGTDVWWATLDVEASSVFTYGFRELTATTNTFADAVRAHRQSGEPATLDPFNHDADIDATGTGALSIASMDEAPNTDIWRRTHQDELRGSLLRSRTRLPTLDRAVEQLTYIPHPDTVRGPARLLVVTDAEVWFDRLGLPWALEEASAAGTIRPVAVLGISNEHTAERIELLGANPGFVDDLATFTVPAARRTIERTIPLQGVEGTVLSGQSLGGLTALLAALRRPDCFGHVQSHSPSLWWTPDGSVTPANYAHEHQPWINEQFARETATSTHIDLRVGTREDITNDHVDQLHDILISRGYRSRVTHFSGGHDFACWRHALIDGLKEK
ncbi:MAG: DUF3327 domain-containing protein [Brevibacterium sp.]|nr:DUF3327 domain-containing protein [Brevibacterium sp.]MDN6174140.1 DUF3327 domain-containing protein [Brevibacterium sp.]